MFGMMCKRSEVLKYIRGTIANTSRWIGSYFILPLFYSFAMCNFQKSRHINLIPSVQCEWFRNHKLMYSMLLRIRTEIFNVFNVSAMLSKDGRLCMSEGLFSKNLRYSRKPLHDGPLNKASTLTIERGQLRHWKLRELHPCVYCEITVFISVLLFMCEHVTSFLKISLGVRQRTSVHRCTMGNIVSLSADGALRDTRVTCRARLGIQIWST